MVAHVEISTILEVTKMEKINKYLSYEKEKNRLALMNLTQEEYERRVRELANRLKI